MEKKMTKIEMFTALKELVATSVEVDEETKAAYEEFIDKELASIEKRKESAQKRAAANKEVSDALTNEILAIVQNSGTVMLVDDIVEALGNEEITRNKVTARLGKLVANGDIIKNTVKVDGSRKMGYQVADAE